MRLTELKGIGPKTEEAFLKLGVHNVEELLQFYPRDYELFSAPVTVQEIGIRNFAAVKGMFTQPASVRRAGRLQIVTAFFKDETGVQMKVVWFNAAFMKNQIRTDRLYVLRGRTTRKYGTFQMEQPKMYEADQYRELLGKQLPVYPLVKDIRNGTVRKAIQEALNTQVPASLDDRDPVPVEIRKKYGLCSKSFAVRNIHFPGSTDDFRTALRRLSFEEIFLFIYQMKCSDKDAAAFNGICIPEADQTKRFLEELPFRLTGAQQKVYSELMEDLSSGRQMNRLIQGDVGSGKTILALLVLMNAGYAGYQGALMAPTEVLAAQHYESITGYFKQHGISLHIALLTGSMKPLEKKVVYDALEDGRIDILVGTHALIQEKVHFKNLGLVVTDEQHRFGTKQRAALAQKAGVDPHRMVMSATPIPRTLALILYGGMDVSVINELPADRKPVKNAVIDETYRENAYRLMKREIAKGHQVYIICPLVDYSEGLDAQNVTDYTQMLKEEVFCDGTVVGMLHGQMKADAKNEVMEQFAAGQIQVLVSTTVVEVGVNVPNATVMMIEDADRFGLSALHQLRGRVGRGADQSYCMFMSGKKTEGAQERLNVLKESNDGFVIASKDLEMRGPGEFNGIRQSGMLNFRIFDVYRDTDLAQEALQAVSEALEKRLEMPDLILEQTIIL